MLPRLRRGVLEERDRFDAGGRRTARGVLRPGETAQVADLRRDHPVAPELQPFVERYWSVRWDLTGRAPFRSEVLSHPSVNVSVESGTHPRFGHDAARRPGARRGHPPVRRRPASARGG